MARTSGLRDRVYHAMIASAGIFTLALTFWGVQSYQQSEANAPTVATTPTTTVTFDDKPAGDLAGNAYADKGIEFSSPDGGGAGATLFVPSSAACPSYTAPSTPNMLVAKPGSYAPLTLKFTQGRVSDQVTFQVGNAGNAEVAIEVYDHTGKKIDTKTVPAPGSGACVNTPVTLASTGIAEVRLKKNAAGTTDGFGIDNLAFSALRSPVDQTFTISVTPTTGKAPLSVALVYTGSTVLTESEATVSWGDGQTDSAVGKTAQHTYTQPGTYTILYSAGGKSATASVVVTDTEPTTASTTLVTDKTTYKPGETVTFTLKNNGPASLELANGAPYTITANGQGVYSPVSTQTVSSLGVGKSNSWTWNQKNDAGAQVKSDTYVVTVSYSVNGKTESKSAAFSVTADAKPVDPKGTFSITPTTGAAPLTVTAKCEGDTITNLVVDFGDGTVVEKVTCPTTLTHTYQNDGTYTVTVRQSDKVLLTQTVTVAKKPEIISPAPQEIGKGKPSVLASTGANLLLVLLLAAVLSGLVSYFIIRRPFHGDAKGE